MDILSGLFGIGSYMNSKDVPVHENINTKTIKRTPTNGSNLYSNARYDQNELYVDNVAFERYKLAENPEETGVVPNFYNQMKSVQKRDKIYQVQHAKEQAAKKKQQQIQNKNQYASKVEGFDNDSVFSDEGTLCSNETKGSVDMSNDYQAFFKKGNMLRDSRLHEKKFINKAKNDGINNFTKQFTEMAYDNNKDPVSSNGVTNNTSLTRFDMEREMAFSSFKNDNDMTYGVVGEKNFMHNNMVPFFKSGTGKGYNYDSLVTKKLNDTNQRKLEMFTGSINDLNYRPKTERRPLFNPQVGLTWIYGTPNFTNYMESRYIPGKERRNEFIHQPVRITPGLNIGYNEYSKQGFQDTYRALPKTVDELRAANNPKISYAGRIIPGKKSDRRGIIPNVGKYRPIKFKEQDPRDLQKSLGYYRAQAIYGNYDVPSTQRQMSNSEWYGPVGFSNDAPRPESMLEKYRLPNRENFEYPEPKNITQVEANRSTTSMANTYHLEQTHRSTTSNNTYVPPAAPEYKQTYAWDYQSNIPDPTLRNNTELNGYVGHANPKDYNIGGYQAALGGTHAPLTMRSISQNTATLGPAAPNSREVGGFQIAVQNIHMPVTHRETTEKTGTLGPLGPVDQQRGGYQVEAFTTVAPPTFRSTQQNNTTLGPVGNAEYFKGGYIASLGGTVAPDTLKQLTQVNTNPGFIGNGPFYKGGYSVESQNIHVPATIRDQTQVTTTIGPAGSAQYNKGGYSIEAQNIHLPVTNRSIMQTNTNPGFIGNGPFYKPSVDITLQNIHMPPTKRNITQINTNPGFVGSATFNKSSYDITTQTIHVPATLRDTTQYNGTLGPLGTGERNLGGYLPNISGTQAPLTLRSLTQQNSSLGPAAPNQREVGGYAIQASNTVAPPTQRQMTENTSQLNPVAPNGRAVGAFEINVQNTQAPTTLRQIVEKNTYQGPVIMHEGQKTRTRGDIDNSLTNIQKDLTTIVRDGGSPCPSNYDVGPMYDYTMTQLKEPIVVNRQTYGTAIGQNVMGCVSTAYTRGTESLPQTDWYNLDTCIVSNLQSNPYVNNIVFKSVEY
jgi:hypothetical protein